MADDARLLAVVEANTKQFENALKRLEGVTKNSTDRMTASVKKMDSSFASVGKRLDSVGKGLAGFVTVGAIQQVIKETIAWGDALGDLADQTGLTTKQIQVLRYAAKQTGSSADQMDAALKKFGVTLGQARTKGNDLKKILDANGISLTDMAGKARPASDVLNDVIDLIGRMGDEQQKAAVIAAAFGKGNDELITTFRKGLGPIEAWGKALGDTGIVSDDVISKLGALDTKFNDVMVHIQAVAANVVANMQLDVLLDYVSRSVDELADLVNIANMLQAGDVAGAVTAATTRGVRRMTPQQKVEYDITNVKSEQASLFERLELLKKQADLGAPETLTAMKQVSDAIEEQSKKLKELMELREKLRKEAAKPAPTPAHAKPAVVPDLGGGGKKKTAKDLLNLTEIHTKRGLKGRVAGAYSEQFQGLIDYLEAMGYDITNLGEGGYGGPRRVRGPGTKGGWSKHGIGQALDINPQINKFRSPLTTNLPPNIAQIAEMFGLTWGGTWKIPDAMHFQVKRKLGQEELNKGILATGQTEEQVKAIADETERANKAALDNADAWLKANDAITNANQALKRDVVGGLIKDLERGVKPAEAFANALMKISDVLLDRALNAIFPDVGGGILGAVFAGGGVMTGRGPMPLRKYAGGGVAHSPQLAMFGEGGRPEAYVPLPDGRRIPVNIRVPGMGGLGGGRGGQAVAVHNRVTVDPSPLFVVTTHEVARQAGHAAVAEAGDASRRRPGGR